MIDPVEVAAAMNTVSSLAQPGDELWAEFHEGVTAIEYYCGGMELPESVLDVISTNLDYPVLSAFCNLSVALCNKSRRKA